MSMYEVKPYFKETFKMFDLRIKKARYQVMMEFTTLKLRLLEAEAITKFALLIAPRS
jgi:tellurite resistance protein